MRNRRTFPLLLIAAILFISCGGTKNVGGGLWATMGGGSGVSALANSFSANLKENAAASQALGAAGIESARHGLYNTIAKAGGFGVEKGTDLASVLKGMNLDAAAVNGIGESLNAAMDDQNLRPDQEKAVTELWNTASKGLGR
jgi:hypothetical protein